MKSFSQAIFFSQLDFVWKAGFVCILRTAFVFIGLIKSKARNYKLTLSNIVASE